MSMIGVQRRLTELGRIRLGDKGTKGQPQKLSKFRLTSASRPLLEAAARMYGGTVRAWQGAPDDGFWELYTETDALDIMVPPIANAYSQMYETWDAGGCTLRCDGTWESIAEEPCSHGDHEGMRVTTRVSIILPKLPGLGTWRLDTNGWNAAATLPAAIDMLQAAGRTGWLPALLRLEQQSSKKKVPGEGGKLRSQTFRYVVPVIDLIGVTFAELLAGGSLAPTEIGGHDAPALGTGAIVGQQSPVGPSRGRRGGKVDRPQLGPPPALPAVSDFRKPDAPPAPASPVLPATAPVEAPAAATAVQAPPAAAAEPASVSGWLMADDAAPAPAKPVKTGKDAPPPPPPLTQDELKARIREAKVDLTVAEAVFRRRFPNVPSLGSLDDDQRGRYWHELSTVPPASAVAPETELERAAARG